MRKVAVDDVDPDPYDESLHSDRRDLTDPLDAAHVAVVRYALAPGERFSGAVHAHADQEEVFLVLAGEATFDTRDGEVTVGPNETIRFAPGEFQSGYNAADERLVALALGAPRDSEDVRITRIPVRDDRDVECPDCGRDDLRIGGDVEGGLVCPDCGTEQVIE